MGAVKRVQVADGVRNGAWKGRGTAQNPANRFEREHTEPIRRWLGPRGGGAAPANQPDARCDAQHHRPQ